MRERTLERSLQRHSNKALLKKLDKVDSEGRLRDFIELGWHVLEPGREFHSGWHIDAVCDHLEAVTAGHIIRLLINVPPGFMKSLATDVFWPAWEWGPKNKPDMRYVCASYSETLTVRDNRRTRSLIKSPFYQEHWGNRFSIVSDQDAKVRFDNDKTGWKLATSVGGVGTGERGDRVIIDDPHNVREGESELKRLGANLWFTEVVPTRVNDPEKSAIVVIMQRVHEDDISGTILARELGYEHLMLPMEFDPERRCSTSIGFTDPRTEENELLWPTRMTRQVIERDKKVLGQYATAGQLQQRPAPRGGGMFKQEWFEVVDAAPAGGNVVRSWDLAASEGERAAWTAGVRIKRAADGILYIEDMRRIRGSPKKVEDLLVNTATQDGNLVRIGLPQDPGQAGKSQKRYLVASLVGYDVLATPETGDKETRARPFAAQAEAGNVKVVRGDWNGAFFDELNSFPMGTFKDQVDACSRGVSMLIGKISSIWVPQPPEIIPFS